MTDPERSPSWKVVAELDSAIARVAGPLQPRDNLQCSPKLPARAVRRRPIGRRTTPILLTPKQAARHLNLSVSWLAKRRLAGDGPPYIKLGGAVRYAEASLQQWMKGQQRTSTSG